MHRKTLDSDDKVTTTTSSSTLSWELRPKQENSKLRGSIVFFVRLGNHLANVDKDHTCRPQEVVTYPTAKPASTHKSDALFLLKVHAVTKGMTAPFVAYVASAHEH